MHAFLSRARAPRRLAWSGLVVALGLYAWLEVTTVRAPGVVGEVATGWASAAPPRTLVEVDPPTFADAGGRAGPLAASRTRPVERLVVGDVSVPLAINAYTGGPADWPARAARAVAGDPRAGIVVHVLLGGLLLILAHRFLRFHASFLAAGLAALLLASDWNFVFYKKVLGGTEILLQAAGLLVVWALWSRRWRAGVHGTTALAVGIGLGLLAKVTFAASLGALAVAAWATRGERPPGVAPTPFGVRVCLRALGMVAVLVSPLVVAAVHACFLEAPAVGTHDTLPLQLGRWLARWTPGGGGMAREGAHNLSAWFGNPLTFFGPAYGARVMDTGRELRWIFHGVTLVGVLLAWKERRAVGGHDPAGALLRFLSVAAPLQVGALFLANGDLHHLAQASVTWALLAALAVERVAATLAPPRSLRRAAVAVALVAPSVVAGVSQLRATDFVVASGRVPSFTEAGQRALEGVLREACVQRVLTTDYEIAGVLEARGTRGCDGAPLELVHAWPAVARRVGGRQQLGPAMLSAAADLGPEGGAYLAVRPSAPFIYDWFPGAEDVALAARGAGLQASILGELRDEEGPWATLWRVHRAPSPTERMELRP